MEVSIQLSQGIVIDFPYVIFMRRPISVDFHLRREIRVISLTSLRDRKRVSLHLSHYLAPVKLHGHNA